MTDRAAAVVVPELRPMRWWDVEPVSVLERELFPHDAWSPEMFWSELAHPDTRHYLVADAAGEIVGYAGLLANDGTGDIQTVAVAPTWQGAGLGRRLVNALLTEAAVRRCEEVLLEVRADNDAAKALYERLGFRRIAVRRNYYPPGVDGVVMRLTGVLDRQPAKG